MSDGACNGCDVQAAARYRIIPMVRVLCSGYWVSPALMGMGPVYATRKLLHRSGMIYATLDSLK